jgi:hypothetical protein
MVKINSFLCRIANLPLICLVSFVLFIDHTPTEFKLFGYLKVKRKFLFLNFNLWYLIVIFLRHGWFKLVLSYTGLQIRLFSISSLLFYPPLLHIFPSVIWWTTVDWLPAAPVMVKKYIDPSSSSSWILRLQLYKADCFGCYYVLKMVLVNSDSWMYIFMAMLINLSIYVHANHLRL